MSSLEAATCVTSLYDLYDDVGWNIFGKLDFITLYEFKQSMSCKMPITTNILYFLLEAQSTSDDRGPPDPACAKCRHAHGTTPFHFGRGSASFVFSHIALAKCQM